MITPFFPFFLFSLFPFFPFLFLFSFVFTFSSFSSFASQHISVYPSLHLFISSPLHLIISFLSTLFLYYLYLTFTEQYAYNANLNLLVNNYPNTQNTQSRPAEITATPVTTDPPGLDVEKAQKMAKVHILNHMSRKKYKDKPRPEGNIRIPIWNRIEQRKVSGFASPMYKNLQTYLTQHPDCEVYDKDVHRRNDEVPAGEEEEEDEEQPTAKKRKNAASTQANKKIKLAVVNQQPTPYNEEDANSKAIYDQAQANMNMFQRNIPQAQSNYMNNISSNQANFQQNLNFKLLDASHGIGTGNQLTFPHLNPQSNQALLSNNVLMPNFSTAPALVSSTMNNITNSYNLGNNNQTQSALQLGQPFGSPNSTALLNNILAGQNPALASNQLNNLASHPSNLLGNTDPDNNLLRSGLNLSNLQTNFLPNTQTRLFHTLSQHIDSKPATQNSFLETSSDQFTNGTNGTNQQSLSSRPSNLGTLGSLSTLSSNLQLTSSTDNTESYQANSNNNNNNNNSNVNVNITSPNNGVSINVNGGGSGGGGNIAGVLSLTNQSMPTNPNLNLMLSGSIHNSDALTLRREQSNSKLQSFLNTFASGNTLTSNNNLKIQDDSLAGALRPTSRNDDSTASLSTNTVNTATNTTVAPTTTTTINVGVNNNHTNSSLTTNNNSTVNPSATTLNNITTNNNTNNIIANTLASAVAGANNALKQYPFASSNLLSFSTNGQRSDLQDLSRSFSNNDDFAQSNPFFNFSTTAARQFSSGLTTNSTLALNAAPISGRTNSNNNSNTRLLQMQSSNGKSLLGTSTSNNLASALSGFAHLSRSLSRPNALSASTDLASQLASLSTANLGSGAGTTTTFSPSFNSSSANMNPANSRTNSSYDGVDLRGIIAGHPNVESDDEQDTHISDSNARMMNRNTESANATNEADDVTLLRLVKSDASASFQDFFTSKKGLTHQNNQKTDTSADDEESKRRDKLSHVACEPKDGVYDEEDEKEDKEEEKTKDSKNPGANTLSKPNSLLLKSTAPGAMSLLSNASPATLTKSASSFPDINGSNILSHMNSGTGSLLSRTNTTLQNSNFAHLFQPDNFPFTSSTTSNLLINNIGAHGLDLQPNLIKNGHKSSLATFPQNIYNGLSATTDQNSLQYNDGLDSNETQDNH